MDESLLPPHVPCAIRAEQTHLRIPSRPEWIAATAEFLEHKAVLCGACPEARRERLHAALHEALSNAILHGNLQVAALGLKERGPAAFTAALAERAADPRYAGRFVDIEIVYNGQRCDWVLTQEGPGFDIDTALLRLAREEANGTAGGRGLLLMRALVDEVRFAAGGRQVTLSVRKSGCPEKRREERRPAHGPVRVAPVRADGSGDWDAAHEAVARNVSAGGLGLLQSRPATSEQVLLGIGGGGELRYVPAEVRHARRSGENEVEVGYRFQAAAPPNAETALGLRADGGRAVPRELRAHPRFLYTERIIVRSEAGAGPTGGHGANLSRAGMAFIAPAPLRAGPCVLELPQDGACPLRVRAEVLRCDAIAGAFHGVAARILGLAAQAVTCAGRPGS